MARMGGEKHRRTKEKKGGGICAPPPLQTFRSLTSKRWELTFFPFFIQVMRGLGSPEAWHTNEATPPEMPV